MTTTNSRNLTLTTVGANTTVNVTYNAVVTSLERHLAEHGMVFQELIRVIGVDPAGSITGTVLHSFPVQNLPVTPGAGAQVIARNRSLTVTRASLQEDVALGDDDEIRCSIVIRPIGLPSEIEGFTDQEILLG